MRPATKEERKSVDRYIKSISHKTGVMFDNLTPKEKGEAFYEAGYECAIDDVLKIINKERESVGGWANKFLNVRDAVMALKGGEDKTE